MYRREGNEQQVVSAVNVPSRQGRQPRHPTVNGRGSDGRHNAGSAKSLQVDTAPVPAVATPVTASHVARMLERRNAAAARYRRRRRATTGNNRRQAFLQAGSEGRRRTGRNEKRTVEYRQNFPQMQRTNRIPYARTQTNRQVENVRKKGGRRTSSINATACKAAGRGLRRRQASQESEHASFTVPYRSAEPCIAEPGMGTAGASNVLCWNTGAVPAPDRRSNSEA